VYIDVFRIAYDIDDGKLFTILEKQLEIPKNMTI
jgi:hypothetical protein